MQIPIINGIYADSDADFRTSYPRNYVPVPKDTGINAGYLKPAEGIVGYSPTTPGVDRGGINWRGVCYRVCGPKLCRIDANGTPHVLGDVGGVGQVSFDYSFERLAVTSDGSLYYWNGSTLTQVTDPDLGRVLDVLWVDGYFMTTDGEFLVVTELNDPTEVNPEKYGSSEVDPDPVVALVKLRNEPHAVNRYTIEPFQNVGGTGFPFTRIDGAQIPRGAVGTHACAVLAEQIAFVGGGRNEPPAVWLGYNGSASKISTREIDLRLKTYTEQQLADVVTEVRVDLNHQTLYVHLPDVTYCYDAAASASLQTPVWYSLTSGVLPGQYLARNYVWCYDEWLVGHPRAFKTGRYVSDIGEHWGAKTSWEWGTMMIFNSGQGACVHEITLTGLAGRVSSAAEPLIATSYTLDGQTWSQDRTKPAGRRGQTRKRLQWLKQGHMRNYRAQRFTGTSDAHVTINRLDARVEPLGA